MTKLRASSTCDPPWEVQQCARASQHDRSDESDFELLDVEFVDDALFMIMREDAAAVVGCLAAALDIVADSFAAFGLKLNLKPGKTEAILHLVGPRSKVVFRDMDSDPVTGNRVLVTPAGRRLQIVEQYKTPRERWPQVWLPGAGCQTQG